MKWKEYIKSITKFAARKLVQYVGIESRHKYLKMLDIIENPAARR